MIVAGTGHRSPRLQGRKEIITELTQRFLEKHRPEAVISGLAEGFDQILAVEALAQDIPLISAMPWKGYGSHWSPEHKEILDFLLKSSQRVVVTSEVDRYTVAVYHLRNKWMVDNSTDLLVCWDGEEDGGTYDAVVYAQKVGRTMHRLPWLP